MQMLSGQPMTFDAVDSGIQDLTVRNKILQNFMAPETITLKKGAQVMLIKNYDSQLVNGSLGKIQSFMDESTFHVYKDDEETFLRAQEPEGGSDAEEKAAAREDPEDEIARQRREHAKVLAHGPFLPSRWLLPRAALSA